MRKLVVLTVLSLALSGNIGTKTAQAAGLSAQQKEVHTKNLQASKSVVRWFDSRKHRWRLHRRFDTCNDVRERYSAKRAGVCYLSRLAYERHTERVVRLRAILFPLPPHYQQWLCIHSHEAAWDNPGVDWRGNPSPYYGGLQMDLAFQRAYGPELLARKGTANNWTPLEQMWVAERALKARGGFNPWPNTARYCGLPLFF